MVFEMWGVMAWPFVIVVVVVAIVALVAAVAMEDASRDGKREIGCVGRPL